MEQLEDLRSKINNSNFQVEKYLPVEIAFEDFNVMVCGRTETALKWAEKFLKYGLITSIQFETIPEQLMPYRGNIRYFSDDFQSGDHISGNTIAAIATGNPELDQILALKFYDSDFQLIMSETPCRFANMKFPEDKMKVSIIEESPDKYEGKPIIKVGIFEDELENTMLNSAYDDLEKNYPDFHFEKKILKTYDPSLYHLRSSKTFGDLNKEANKSYTRGFNALYRDNVDLVLVDSKTIPDFYSADIEFWPDLIERFPTFIVMISPEGIEDISDFPEDFTVYLVNYPDREIFSLITVLIPDYDFDHFKTKKLSSSKSVNNIENLENIAIITNANDFFNNVDTYKKLISKGFSLSFPRLTSKTLDGLIVGVSRKDNQSRALKMLKVAAQKKFPDQSLMFTNELICQKLLYPYYGNYWEYLSYGSFVKLDGKYRFEGYSETKHGYFVRSNRELRDTMDEAIEDMYDFINRSIRIW